mmetsp:Transcript_38770/g.81519  ORF Transcript_38770/g.81519 Transcript_38770/m.81519 type:complete len:216 (-) Transcript_38770:171-818(-)|eukprot:CAMPEP_0183716254 /NCGR_PEP_ID=MMETSP0737-20130205/10235_1 /TAXON_ID=385413 /ORGANISM="Thalassiosira miniscula, Strain CCMP1093" /LENGTH=215 /DNA_ID=CAMNT_0025945493 /DNA_START=51 /DNA_END=698 /DNA_ORIENTATION=-
MGLTQTKLHWYVLAQDWKACYRRLEKSQGAEARTFNPFGDLPLHLACYDGQAPPDIIRALIDAYPDSVRKENKYGRDPLELAAKNYRIDHPHRAEVLALLRWHRPENSPASDTLNELPGIFTDDPPEQFFSASALCVVCMEEPACIATIPCGHICLCMKCVRTALRKGRCPVDRCEVQGLYKLQGDQIQVHESMCNVGVDDYGHGESQSEMEVAC